MEVIEVRSRRAAIWAVRKGRGYERRYVSVEIACRRKAKVERVLDALDDAALAHGVLLVRNTSDQDHRRVTLRYPPSQQSDGPPSAGDREPRNPLPSTPSTSRRQDSI